MTFLLGALAALLLLGTTGVLLLRAFFTIRSSMADSMDRADFSWRDYKPIERLLAPADFDYLRRRGVSEDRIKNLRAERRRIYRLFLRSLASDFNQAHRALSLLIVQSQADRPDLASELARQRFAFFRNLLLAEFRLALNACGVEMPAIDLCAPLALLQEQLRQLAPAASAA